VRVLALPVAIISSGFAQEVNRRDFVITWSLMSRIPVLAELDAQQVAEVLPLRRAHNLPPHVAVVPEGGRSDAMYFVASGSVHRKPSPSDEVFKTGDVFGIGAMLEGEPSGGAFVTTSRCRLLKLFREDFHRLETANPAFAEVLPAAASRRGQNRAGRRLRLPTPGLAPPRAGGALSASGAALGSLAGKVPLAPGRPMAPSRRQPMSAPKACRGADAHADTPCSPATPHPACHPVRQPDARARPDRSRRLLPVVARP